MVIATINVEKDWQTTIKVNERNITFKIDMGAQCNVVSKESYEMKLVKRIESITEDILSKYTDTFTGQLDCITGVTHHIKVDPNYKPVVDPPLASPSNSLLKGER